MLRLSLLTLLAAAAAVAQTPEDLFNKPPAGVEEALRARMTEFYQHHVDEQFRKAEALVAEDTQEFFYTRNKPHYLSFEIKEIRYSDNFTKAKATVVCEMLVMMPGFAGKPMKMPTASYWKLEKGKWFWYVDMDMLRDSPFGKLNPGKGPATSPLPSVIPSTADFIMNQVKLDVRTVTVTKGQSEKVTITNTAPGQMNISHYLDASGVSVELDKTALGAGEKAVLTIKAGENAKPGTVSIRVLQTGENLPIRIGVK